MIPLFLSIIQFGTLICGAKSIDLIPETSCYVICFLLLMVIWTITDSYSIPLTNNYIFIAAIILDIDILWMTRKLTINSLGKL